MLRFRRRNGVLDKGVIYCGTGGYVTQDELPKGYEKFYKRIGEISGKGFYECNIQCDLYPSKDITWMSDPDGLMAAIYMGCAEDRTNIGYEIKDALEKNDSKLTEKLLFEFKQVWELI